MLCSILATAGGLLAASSFIVTRKPDARQALDRLVPYQGAIGMGMLTLGVLWFLKTWPGLTNLLSRAPLRGGATIAVLVCTNAVGFILAYGLISKFLIENHEFAPEHGTFLLVKLARVQVPLGLATAVFGLATLAF